MFFHLFTNTISMEPEFVEEEVLVDETSVPEVEEVVEPSDEVLEEVDTTEL